MDGGTYVQVSNTNQIDSSDLYMLSVTLADVGWLADADVQ